MPLLSWRMERTAGFQKRKRAVFFAIAFLADGENSGVPEKKEGSFFAVVFLPNGENSGVSGKKEGRFLFAVVFLSDGD